MTATAERRPEQRPGLVGPVILISLGLVLLLNNLGLIGWGIWDVLFRLWPLLLIAIGLELIIGRRSPAAGLIIPLLLVAGVGLTIWWSGAWAGAGAALQTMEIQQPIAGAGRAEVTIGGVVGELRVGAMDEPEGLIAGTVRLRPGARVNPSFEERDGVAYYTLREQADGAIPPWNSRGASERWDLRLNPALPTRLTIDGGVGQTIADLRRLRVTDLQINGGVGQVQLTLPRRGEIRAAVSGGVGQTVITIPAGLAARITLDRGLGDVQVPASYTRSGDVYLSPGYANAEDRVELAINGGVGGIAIRAAGD